MKILISIILLEIANFSELNATGTSEAGTSRPSVNNPRPRSKIRKNKKPQKIITIGEAEFGVWNWPGGKPREVSLVFPTKNFVPDDEYRKHHFVENRYVEKDGVRFVTFMENGHFLGSQYASSFPDPNKPILKDLITNHVFQSHSNQPTRTFIFDHNKIGVWEDAAGIPRAVGLISGNVIPTEKDRKKIIIDTKKVYQDGVFFLVHRVLPSENILGVELAP